MLVKHTKLSASRRSKIHTDEPTGKVPKTGRQARAVLLCKFWNLFLGGLSSFLLGTIRRLLCVWGLFVLLRCLGSTGQERVYYSDPASVSSSIKRRSCVRCCCLLPVLSILGNSSALLPQDDRHHDWKFKYTHHVSSKTPLLLNKSLDC